MRTFMGFLEWVQYGLVGIAIVAVFMIFLIGGLFLIEEYGLEKRRRACDRARLQKNLRMKALKNKEDEAWAQHFFTYSHGFDENGVLMTRQTRRNHGRPSTLQDFVPSIPVSPGFQDRKPNPTKHLLFDLDDYSFEDSTNDKFF